MMSGSSGPSAQSLLSFNVTSSDSNLTVGMFQDAQEQEPSLAAPHTHISPGSMGSWEIPVPQDVGQMAVDGTDPELIEQIVNSELDAISDRHDTGKAIFDSFGRYAPAFGMIGTLVGLVVMLMNMDDPSKIGPGMAIALLTTLYGSMFANMFSLPIAGKLALRNDEELLRKTIVLKGVMSIQSGDNPRIVEQKLKTFLPPGLRGEGEGEQGQ